MLKINSLTSDVELLGSTIDDAAGEAYDKVARLIGAGYPGGPVIDTMARQGNPTAFKFPRGLTAPKFMGNAQEPGKDRYNWSFSGLKTAVSRAVEQFERRDMDIPVNDIAASFQEAVADVITHKAVLAATEHGIDHILLGGGVAANSRLRALLTERTAAAGIGLTIPPINLCTDNGAMVGPGCATRRGCSRTIADEFSADPTQSVNSALNRIPTARLVNTAKKFTSCGSNERSLGQSSTPVCRCC